MATNRGRNKGGMNYSKSASTMRAEEKRIAELEKVAASAAAIKSLVHQQQMQQQLLQHGLPMSSEAPRSHTALGSRHSTISGSEADFLVRQISTAATQAGSASSVNPDGVADISAQLSMFSNLDGFESLGTADGLSEMGLGANSLATSPPTKKGNKNVSAKDIIAEAFRERVANLERQLINATHNLEKCERDVEARDAKIKRLTLDLEVVRKEASNDLSRLQSEHEVEILRIREQHTREKALYIASNANVSSAMAASSNSSNANSPTTKGPNAGSSSSLSAANSKLIEQLEQLRLEQRRMQDTFADERRSAQIDFSNKMLAQERKLKAEIMELKSNTAVLEDKILTKNEEYNHALIQIEHMKHLNLQLEMNKKEAIEGQNKLRADLKIMQQSVQASYRLDTSQQQHQPGATGAAVGTTGGGVDPETAMRLNDAKNEAKSRQLMNKVEFLKAQLDAEKKANEDLKQSMEATRQKLEDVREEFKYRMQECERIKQQAVEEAEQRVEYQYEERMKELTALQTKVMMLQGQYTEIYQENLNSKQQEERARMISNKQLAITATLKTEVEQQRALIEQLRNEKETETLKENSKQNNDAIIRRLDNERQYLKSQLTSEMTHKNELQNALHKCTQQNQEMQKQWSDDVMTLKDSLHQEQQKFKDRVAHYKQVESSLTTELNTTKSQLKELKDGFMKQRDGLRMEQLANENTITANRRLTEQLELANSDIAQLKANDALTAQQFKAQIEAINASIQQQEAAHQEEMTKLKEELADQYVENAKHQTNALAMLDKSKKDHFKMVRLVHTTRLAKTFNKWMLAKIYRSFRLWKTNSTLVAVAVQIRGQVEELLKKNTDDLHAEQKRALEVQKKKLDKEHHIQTQLLKADHEQALTATLQKCEEEKQAALQALTDEHNATVAQLEADFNFDLMSTKKGYEEKIYGIEKKNELDREVLIQKHKDASEAASELSRHRIAIAKEQKEAEMNELWTEKMRQFDAEQTAAHEAFVKQLTTEHADHVAQLVKDHKDKIVIIKIEHEEYVHQTIEQLEAKHSQHLMELGMANDNKMKEFEAQIREEERQIQQKMRAELHEANEARIRELRQLWQQEWDELMVQKTKEFEERLAEKMEEYAKSVEADRLKAIKLEGSKWKQAIKEMEQNNELVIMKARAETAHQKDTEFKLELERLNNKFEAQKMKDFQLHAQMMSDLKHENARALEKQKNKFELQCEELRLEVTESVTLALEEQWEAKMKTMQKEAEQRWSRALETEKENVAKLQKDLATTQELLAVEKTNLQRTIQNCDARVAQMELLNNSDIQMLKDEFENERENLRNKGFDDLRLQRIAFDEEKVQFGIELEGKHKFILDSQISYEKQRLTDEYENKITDLCYQRDQAIADLNKVIAGLNKNKDDLTLELSNVTNRLEDTEDALYDSQTECKKIQKEQSLVIWKAATNMMQMKIRFQNGIKQFDMEANKRYEQIKREMQNKLNDVTLLTWQLTVLLNEVESNRVRTFTTLTNYRVDEIAKKKQLIQKMERELEQITMEKDSLEEQKELMERDVQLLEDQVRELEDQIREHNRESSMVNGRINVAHARKKRRLDSELERMLESIEQKRMNQSVIEQKTAEKARERDEKELEMIDLEKMLVGILVEQQKQIMSSVDEGKTVEERCKALASAGRIPYPINYAPSIEDVVKLMKQREKEDEMYA